MLQKPSNEPRKVDTHSHALGQQFAYDKAITALQIEVKHLKEHLPNESDTLYAMKEDIAAGVQQALYIVENLKYEGEPPLPKARRRDA